MTFREIFSGKGRYVRRRSVDHVIGELIYARRCPPGINRIKVDENVIFDQDPWIEEFCQEFKKEINLPFELECYPTRINDDFIDMLAAAGLDRVRIGVQSGSERIRNDLFRRPGSNSQLLDIATKLSQKRISLVYDVIVNNPFEGLQDKEQTFQLLMDLPKPKRLAIYSLSYFPGSSLTVEALGKGLISPEEVQGDSYKGPVGWKVMISRTSHDEDLFWSSLVVLLSRHVPKMVIRKLNKISVLHKYPSILAWLVLNDVVCYIFRLLENSLRLLRRIKAKVLYLVTADKS